MDQRGFDLWQVPPSNSVSFENLSLHIHPADRAPVRAAFAAARGATGAYDVDFRVMIGDDIRWVSARGEGGHAAILDSVMFGIFLDVSERKRAEESHDLLAGEMSHRVKNLLAIACGLTEITSRSASSAPEMARDLTHRFTALGRAHDLVRPVPGAGEKDVLLDDLLAVLLAPYAGSASIADRVRVTMPRVVVGERSATALALIVHELATNSLKHGALSAASGGLDISCHVDGPTLELLWSERGGPAIVAPTGPAGYGSKLIRRTICGQLGGSIDYDWSGDGVVISLRINPQMLVT
ncbi:MAG: histidine kinase [Sphingomonas bacterium]|uniref:sensor histidine kinase n=1 Tax=Sphingomonas bacterium TaxID=1895847 RepID=UPI00260C2C2C|nr:HWE histidine kinase domain-containing protein [Sphingomonas bacterium]MDB5712486.1 histidine kinase [Sphingomonas bacterium]